MTWILTMSLASAGPVPMFGQNPTPAPAPVAVAPTSQLPVVVTTAVGFGVNPVVVESPPEGPEEAFPAVLPYVEAEPVKTRIAEPGKPIPIDQIPSAFRPIPEAENRLPVVTLQPISQP